MENLESTSNIKYIVLETYEKIDKSYSVKSDSRDALIELYNRIADNYDILLQYGVSYPDRFSENQLEGIKNSELKEEELKQIGKLFRIGILNRFATPTSGDYYENKGLRRDMTEEEKLLFLGYLNRIYGYRGRYELISIFFLERHTEEERDNLLKDLKERNKKYIEEEKTKFLQKNPA
jgi:hypothetical protein